MHEVMVQLLLYLRGMWQFRWYAVAFAWVAAIGGWIAVYGMPDRYQASARVYVDTQSVLRPLLAGLAVQPNVDQLVNMMSRTLISRPNLEKVIRMADMDIKLKTPEDREQLISRLAKGLTIRSAGRENLYTIAYNDQNPQQAKRIVQSLLTIFVEGSLGDKRKDTDSARRFIDEQLKIHVEKLVSAESAVTEFKRKNMGLMGVEGQGYYVRLQQAQATMQQAQLELKEVENARDALKKQIAGETPVWITEQLAGETAAAAAVNSGIDGRIQQLQQKLDNLRLNFTDQHPDIIGTTRIIDNLREQKKEEQKKEEQKRAEAKLKKPTVDAAAVTPPQTQSPVFLQLNLAVTEAEARAAGIKARVAEYEKRYDALKGAANAVPQIEAEFTQLNRDYTVIRRNYDTLLSRRESAQMSGDMEGSASVMDFRVIDPPQVPAAPSAPNRPLLMSMVLLGALGGGLGFAFLISQLRPTFNDERRLREVSGLPVFGTVIMAWTDAQKAKRRNGFIAFLASCLSLFSAYAAVMAALMLTTARI